MDDLERRCLVFLLRIVEHQCTWHGLDIRYHADALVLLDELDADKRPPPRVTAGEVAGEVVAAADEYLAAREACSVTREEAGWTEVGHRVGLADRRFIEAVRRYREVSGE